MNLSAVQLGAIALTALWTATSVAGRSAPPAHPWVVVVSLDTVRADALGAYGGRAPTPHLDALAEQSVWFTRHFTVVPTTLASHASLFTGAYPRTHGVPRNGFVLDAENVALAEILAEQGYETAGFVGAGALGQSTAISQGFSAWDEPVGAKRVGGVVVDRALDWLDRRDPLDERPVFLFVHLYDAHAPYTAPTGYRLGSGRADQYLAGVSWLDHQVGRLLTGLGARDVLPGALLVVTADHGEAFDGHEESFDHGATVYDETTRIPLFLAQPGLPRGASDRLSSNIDVLPTVLDLLGLPPSPGVEGVSFAPTLRGERQASRGVVFSEATKPYAVNPPGWVNADRRKAARTNDLRLVWDPISDRRQLFLTGQDASESEDRWDDLAATPPVRALELSLAAWSAAPVGRPTRAIDEVSAAQALEALGYVNPRP